MYLHPPMKRDQSGFSVIEVLLVVLVVTALAATGVLIYQRHKSISARNSSETNSTQPQNTTATQPAQTTTQYLDIKEWGVRLTLNSTTASLYYYMNPQVSDVAYVSLKTISDVAPKCAADKFALGAISRLTEAEQQAATANPSALNQPGTIHIGNYWYAAGNSHAACTDGTAAMNTAVSKVAPNYNPGVLLNTLNTLAADPTSKHYLTIPEQGIRIKLTANTNDAYYSIRNSPVTGQPPFILLSVHSLDAYPGCGTSQGNDGIAGISTFTKGEADPVVGNFMTSFPNAPQIGGLYYFVEGSQYDCTEGKASTIYSNAKHDFIDAYSTIEKIPN